MRLGAYSGVIAARAYEAQKDEGRGLGHSSSPGVAPTSAPRNDPNLVNKMVAEGWIEHNVEKG